MTDSLYPPLSSIRGKNEAGSLETLTATDLRGPLGMFGEYRVSEGRQIIELKSTYGISALRESTTVAGTGAVTNSGGEYNLSTGTTTGSTALLESKERGRYIPGVEAQCGLGIRYNHTFAGTEYAEWGYFDDDNGFGFGEDATGIYAFYLRAGSKTKVYQSSWNIDTLDGTGQSGFTLDPSHGLIYEIDFTWYGYGSVEWRIVIHDTNTTRQFSHVVHRFKPQGTNSIQDPNLPIRAFVSNGGGTTDIDLYVGGRQFSVFTEYQPNRRINGQVRTAQGSITGSSFIPVMTFRRKSTFSGVSVKLEGFDLITTHPLVWELRLDSTLDATSFGTPSTVTASETAAEVDTTASTMSGGEFLNGGLISTSGSGINAKGAGNLLLGIDIPDVGNVTLGVRPITSSDNATVSSFLRWAEEW